ncbi:hypothetical protein KFY46_25900, partial [Salmonella enterica subsp. enterica serovar 1,4,[5],12:i:-]|nr:hypothetical protein [Salmonella enterica subsp. enterica serovar 1,4,[5],12:i:-]
MRTFLLLRRFAPNRVFGLAGVPAGRVGHRRSSPAAAPGLLARNTAFTFPDVLPDGVHISRSASSIVFRRHLQRSTQIR